MFIHPVRWTLLFLACCQTLFAFEVEFPLTQEKLNKISETIVEQRAEIPEAVWLPAFSSLHVQVASYRRPLAHGTRSEYLESILKNGLGSREHKPKDSMSPELNYYTDLQANPDMGLLGAYFFALRDLSPKALSVDSSAITHRDIFDRYIAIHPILQLNRESSKKKLQANVDHYLDVRGKSSGYPVLFIYEGSALKRLKPGKLDVYTDEVAGQEMLEIAMAPAREVKTTVTSLFNEGVNRVRVYPLELFELNELRISKAGKE